MSQQATFELKRLRPALILFAVLVGASSYAFYYSVSYVKKQKQDEARILTEIRSIQQREHDDYERRRIHREYSRRFAALEKASMFVQESKLDWVEKLELAARHLRIPLTKYELDTRAKMPLPIELPAPELGLYRTPLNLTLTMLHEGDLLAIQNYLHNEDLGLFTFESCQLSRTRDKPSFERLEAIVAAECDINIYNFKFDDTAVDMGLEPGMPAPDV